MKFSILIPTRNRSLTIQSTIETVLENRKGCNDFEIIVSDNSDNPNDMGRIQKLFDEKITFISQGGNLSMSENWEAALCAAQGDYVIILGDDDGLMPFALSTLENIISSTSAQVISWPWIHYAWPSTLPVEHRCDIYMPTTSYTYSTKQALPILQELAASNTCNYSSLPCLYNSAVHREVIERIKSKLGRLFIGRSPDVTSGILIGYTCRTWIRLDLPLSIAGTSPSSNGAAHLQGYNPRSPEIIADFKKLNAEKVKEIEWIPYCMTLYDGVAEELARCHSSYFPKDNKIKINRKRLLEKCFYSFTADTSSEFTQKYEKILFSTKDDSKLTKWFIKKFSRHSIRSRPFIKIDEWWMNRPGLTSRYLTVGAAKVGVNNVLECARYSSILYDTTNNAPICSLNEKRHFIDKQYWMTLGINLLKKSRSVVKNLVNSILSLSFLSSPKQISVRNSRPPK